MRLIPFILLLWCSRTGYGQDSLLNAYLNTLRNNAAELTVFFHQMPKGGDLHHHYSGSIYTETYIQAAIDNDLWIHTGTLDVVEAPFDGDAAWTRFSTLSQLGTLPYYRQRLLERWSVMDYATQHQIPPDDHFFATFGQFGAAKGDFIPANRTAFEQGLQELKRRALRENVQYIETMFAGVPCDGLQRVGPAYDAALHSLQTRRDASALEDTLQTLWKRWSGAAAGCVDDYVGMLGEIHRDLRIDEEGFVMRYQTFALRTVAPTAVFRRLVLCFMAAEASPLVVGVNIVAPEDDPVSMRDYWLHMQMFRFLQKRYPGVSCALHAGELTLGLVPPEELGWHIREAVFTANARRIGHGVDVPWEQDAYALLDSMRARDVAVEINLTSNEFILGVKDDRHPLTLYHRFGVPMVISTDDAGVLRSNLTQQYVLLAQRYPALDYADIRRLVYNSIDYAFVEEAEVRKAMKRDLDRRFAAFERSIVLRATGAR